MAVDLFPRPQRLRHMLCSTQSLGEGRGEGRVSLSWSGGVSGKGGSGEERKEEEGVTQVWRPILRFEEKRQEGQRGEGEEEKGQGIRRVDRGYPTEAGGPSVPGLTPTSNPGTQSAAKPVL